MPVSQFGNYIHEIQAHRIESCIGAYLLQIYLSLMSYKEICDILMQAVRLPDNI